MNTTEKSTDIPKNYADLQLFHFANILTKDFPDKAIKGVIFGNFGAMNYGDEAILAGQLVELQHVKNCSITVVSRFPEQIKEVHHVDAIGLLDSKHLIKAIIASDFIIVGGGGLFCKNDNGVKGFLFQLYTAVMFLLFPKILHKKTYILGIGIYANMDALLAPFVLYLMHTAALITVRDAHSHSYLNQKHIPNKFYKDNRFLMPLRQLTEIKNDTFFKKKLDKKKYNVGLGLKRPDSEKETEKLTYEICKFIIKNAHDTTFWMYPLDANIGVSYDENFAKEISARVIKENTQAIIYIVPTMLHPRDIFSSYKLMNYFIAMRLHASIFCYRNNVPFYGITYDTKCTSFLESINHSTYQILDVSQETMQKEFDTIKKERS